MIIEAIFLGTGTSQGVPMIGCDCEVCRSNNEKDRRLRSSLLVIIDDINIVIDTTPDFRYQMLREGVNHIEAVVYTHGHKDHTGGMDDLRAYNYMTQRPVEIYCEQRVATVIRKDYDYAFAENRYKGVPEVNVNIIDSNPFYINGIEIIPIRGLHNKLPVLGYRIGDLCYITDMNSIEDCELKKLHNLETLVINGLRNEAHISHFTLEQALGIIKKVEPRRAYITHISHQLGLYDQLLDQLPPNVEPAYDKLRIKIRTFVEK